jgi:hypothetical protein
MRDELGDIGHGYTYLPEFFVTASSKAQWLTRFFLGETARSNYWQQAVALYLNAAGIESGYGYFAPNVPSNYKIVFELHYSDGRVEYELPEVHDAEAGLRLSTLLDTIGRTDVPLLREELLRMLAYSAWRQHSSAEIIRAVFGVNRLSGTGSFVRGTKPSYQFIYAYDFRFHRSPVEP